MNIFKNLRKNRRLTQEQLAKELHVEQATISKWETDKSVPDVEALKSIANFFNVSVDLLLGRINRKETILPSKNKITLIGRNGIVEEYILTDEEMSAYQAIFKNREKYKNNNDGNF